MPVDQTGALSMWSSYSLSSSAAPGDPGASNMLVFNGSPELYILLHPWGHSAIYPILGGVWHTVFDSAWVINQHKHFCEMASSLDSHFARKAGTLAGDKCLAVMDKDDLSVELTGHHDDSVRPTGTCTRPATCMHDAYTHTHTSICKLNNTLTRICTYIQHSSMPTEQLLLMVTPHVV